MSFCEHFQTPEATRWAPATVAAWLDWFRASVSTQCNLIRSISAERTVWYNALSSTILWAAFADGDEYVSCPQ